MACKPKLAVEKLLAKEDFFMKAASAKVLVEELVSRRGSNVQIAVA